MKKLLCSFTFWLVVASILIIFMHQIGQDSKNIMLIHFNPILKSLSKSDIMNTLMDSGYKVRCNTIGSDNISIYWYIGSVVTLAFYGLVLDLIKVSIKKIVNIRSK